MRESLENAKVPQTDELKLCLSQVPFSTVAEAGDINRRCSMWSIKTGHLLLTLFLLLGTVFCLFDSVVFAETPSPFAVDSLPGNQAPDFTLKDVNGNSVSLSSFKGKVVLLKFWATWCPPCREEIPSVNALDRLLKNKGLVILSVSVDTSTSKIKDFVKKYPINYTILIDDTMKVTKSLYKAFKLPMAFLIDKRGVIAKEFIYVHDWTSPEVVKEIESYL